jgi:hypothetical protein
MELDPGGKGARAGPIGSGSLCPEGVYRRPFPLRLVPSCEYAILTRRRGEVLDRR